MEDNKKQKDIINETIINGSRVYVEDGEVKVELSESIQKKWLHDSGGGNCIDLRGNKENLSDEWRPLIL